MIDLLAGSGAAVSSWRVVTDTFHPQYAHSFKGGIGRHAQGKLLSTPGSQCAWPQKASKIVLDLITNAESNAEVRRVSI